MIRETWGPKGPRLAVFLGERCYGKYRLLSRVVQRVAQVFASQRPPKTLKVRRATVAPWQRAGAA